MASSARLEGVPPALLAYACPLGGADEPHRGDDSDDRAEEVELEDVSRPERARDDPADQRAGDAEQHGEPSADPLASRQHEPRDDANDDADDYETKDLHGDLFTGARAFETAAGWVRAGRRGHSGDGHATPGREKQVDTREKTVRDRAREAKQDREAAELALDQLQWAINYLYRIRKSAIAERLERNREHILSELRPEP